MDYNGTILCNVPSVEHAGASLRKWDKTLLTWGSAIQDNQLGDLLRSDCQLAFHEAFKRWSDVCALKFQEQDDRNADIVIYAGIQNAGQGGTLAWSELPNGSDGQLEQRYDKREAWIVADNAPPTRIDLTRVACHEIGHAIGISHITPGNLLAPTYSVDINKPQGGDIAAAQTRYGPPTTAPGDDEPGSNPGGVPLKQVVIDFLPNGKIGGTWK